MTNNTLGVSKSYLVVFFGDILSFRLLTFFIRYAIMNTDDEISYGTRRKDMKYKIKDYSDIRKRVDAMDIDDLLRSIVCPNYTPGQNSPQGYEAAAFIHPTTEEQAREEIVAVNKDRKERIMIASDLESGTGKMIKGTAAFPSLMALSVGRDVDTAYEMGLLTGKKARSVGYHWTFSPCVDILANPRSPIVSVRSAGTNADDVLTYGGAYMKGMIDGGLYVTLKHFPGDGYSDHDQHVTTTECPLSREEWDETVGRVYSTLISEGAQAIMPGHISLGAYDEIDPETGFYPPATLSKNLLTGLLREKLGFEGIIISDATNMSGFCGYTYLYDGLSRFLEAGGDCLLFVHANEEYLCEMKKQIEKGNLTMETLRDRAYRMRCFAREYFESFNEPECDDGELDACCEKVTRGAIEVLRDKANVLPMNVKEGTKVAHLVLMNAGTRYGPEGAPAELTAILKERGAQVDTFVDPGPVTFFKAVKNGGYDYIICSVLNEMAFGLNTIKLSGPVARNMMYGWMRYGTPTIFVSYFDPYFAYDYDVLTDTAINTYGIGDYTARALADVLLGEK